MHLSEGILPLAWAAGTTVAAIPFVAAGASQIKKRTAEEPRAKPMIGLIGAALFVISALPIPVPIAGTCSHPTGVGMAAIFIKPLPTAALTFIILAFQALLLAHGGITTLGANILCMGVLGSCSGYGAFLLARRLGLPLWAGAAAAGAVGDLATYGGTALVLAAALHGELPFLTVWVATSLSFLPTQLPLALLEAIITAGMVSFVMERRPDIIQALGIAPRGSQTEEAPSVV